MNKIITTSLATALAFNAAIASAEPKHYKIDTEHTFIQFQISHLGFSWLLGRFNEFEGHFTYDPDSPDQAELEITIATASIDTAHSERDRHLRDDDFLHVGEYPEARFVSTAYEELGDGKAKLEGEFTLRGHTHPVTVDVTHVGHGEDPWGGYRRGFEGTTTLTLEDFGITYDLGPQARTVDLFFSVEGILD